MKVAVTGGTGFVGSHTVAALVRAGHDVRLFARSPQRVGPTLAALGVGDVEVVAGDVTDPAATERALTGVEAVVHAASVYSMDRRAADQIERTNVAGTRLVIETAHRLGARRIVHVSSLVAVSGQRGATVGPDTQPGGGVDAYQRSKVDSDRVARELQAAGAPVRISYPGIVWGPQDPYFGETCVTVRNALRGLMVMLPASTWPLTDVRHLAALHVALVERDAAGARYVSPGHSPRERELIGAIARVTGRRLPVMSVPRAVAMPPPLAARALERVLPVRTPFPYAGAWFVAQCLVADDSATRSDLGLQPRPLDETVADTIRWLARVGYVSRRQAGRLAA